MGRKAGALPSLHLHRQREVCCRLAQRTAGAVAGVATVDEGATRVATVVSSGEQHDVLERSVAVMVVGSLS
jgi:hypothetical protein